METVSQARTRAESKFSPNLDRAEKGSALAMIKADRKARDEKTARLKLLRLAQPEEVVEAPVKKKRAPARKKTA